MNSPNHISKEVLADLESLNEPGSPDILVETISSFLETSPPRVQAILQAAPKSDWLVAAREAHALKSSASTLGALQLGELCQKLEDMAKKANPEAKLLDLVSEISNEHAICSKELEDIRSKRSQVVAKGAA